MQYFTTAAADDDDDDVHPKHMNANRKYSIQSLVVKSNKRRT